MLWRQRAKDERSAHRTTRAELDVCRADTDVVRAEYAQLETARITRASRTWMAVGAGVAGLGAGVAGVGVALDDPHRQPVVLGGLAALGAGVLTAVLAYVFDP